MGAENHLDIRGEGSAQGDSVSSIWACCHHSSELLVGEWTVDGGYRGRVSTKPGQDDGSAPVLRKQWGSGRGGVEGG